MDIQSETALATGGPTRSEFARRGAVALGVSVVVNLIVVYLAAMAGIAPSLEPLSYGPVMVFTTLGVVGATVVYALLHRFVADPDRVFVGVAALVLLLSWLPNVTYAPGLPGATTGGLLVLAVMHLTAAVVSVVVLTDYVAVP
jgi:hypothetical protein